MQLHKCLRERMQLAWMAEEGSKVKLKDYDPDYVDESTDSTSATAELKRLGAELSELQELLREDAEGIRPKALPPKKVAFCF